MSANSQKRTFYDTVINGISSMNLLLLDDMELFGIVTHNDMTRHANDMKLSLD